MVIVLLIGLGFLAVENSQAAEQAGAGAAAFDERCRTPGVVLCLPFSSEAEIAKYLYSPPYLESKNRIRLDPIQLAARFTVPSRSPANTSGALHIRFPRPLVDVYFAFDVRYPADLLRYQFRGAGGWKLFVLGQGSEGCAPFEVVGINNHFRGYPSYYYLCETFAGVEVWNPYKDNEDEFDHQPGGDTECLHSGRRRTRPCAMFVPDQWMTFQVHVNAFARALEVWQTVNGRTLKIVDFNLSKLPADGVSYEWLQLTPYMTGKDPTEVHPQFHFWYRRVIVSTGKIPPPAAD